METNNIDILGLSEIRWSDKGDINFDGFRMIYSGPEKQGKQGVGILLSKNHINKIIQVSCINERLMSIKLESTPVNTVLVQVYMPTSDSTEEEVDKIYELIEDILDNSKNDNVIVMGDFNAVIGEGEQTKYVGKYGLGVRNNRGDRLNEFATNNNMFICNTWFAQPKRRRYTWKMPGDHGRYQLDYILMKVRYRNCVKSCHSYPGADIGSDHNPVVMKIHSIRYKRIKGTKKKVRWNLQELENENICKKYTNAVEEKLSESIKGDAEVRWQRIKSAIKESAKEHIQQNKANTPKKPSWITEEMIMKMDEQKKWKNVNSEEGRRMYRRLNNHLRRITDRAKENWIRDRCTEVEELINAGRSDLSYQIVKQLAGKRRGKKLTQAIMDKDGNLLTSLYDIKNRWKEYIETLYAVEEKPIECPLENEKDVSQDQLGPLFIKTEVEYGMKNLKSGKASPGVDEIPGELLKYLENKAKAELLELTNEIYESGKWPSDFTKSLIIPLEKVKNTNECEKH